MNIFLDDIRIPLMSHNQDKGLGKNYSDEHKWVIVRDYFSFCELVTKNFDNIDLISFDHDLACYVGEREFTGKDAMSFVIDFCIDNGKKLPNWYVHSDNTTGRSNIIGLAISYMKNVEKVDISEFKYFHKGFINGLFYD